MDVAVLLGELKVVIDRVATVDVSLLGAADLQVLVEGLQVESSRLAVAAVAPMQAWEASGGWRSSRARTPGLALGNRVRRCHHLVAAELGRAGKLMGMPLVRAAVSEGRLSIDHVDLFCRYATEARWRLFERDEATLVDACAGLTLFADARKLVRYWADHADDELGLLTRSAPSEVEMSRSRDTGELALRGHLNPVDAEQFGNELERLVREVHLEDRASDIERSAAQRRAVALVRMAQRSASASGVTARPLFQVVLGDATVSRLCELASGHVVRPEDLVGEVGSAVVESFLFDEHHQPIAVSARRMFTGRLRRAIQVRDRRCQHPSGCPVPATDLRSDIDHRYPWSQGGATAAANGQVQCITHNRLHHQRAQGPPPSPPSPRWGVNATLAIARMRWIRLHANDLEPPAAA